MATRSLRALMRSAADGLPTGEESAAEERRTAAAVASLSACFAASVQRLLAADFISRAVGNRTSACELADDQVAGMDGGTSFLLMPVMARLPAARPPLVLGREVESLMVVVRDPPPLISHVSWQLLAAWVAIPSTAAW